MLVAMTRLLAIALVALALAGCPTTNTQPDAPALPDAFQPEVLPGVPNGMQFCELSAAETQAACAYLLARAGGGESRGVFCEPPVNGRSSVNVRTVDQCVADSNDVCARLDGQPCTQPVGASLRLAGATVEACVSGDTPALMEERRVNATILPAPGCIIDRSRAMR
jgi:hypothetical protein